MGGNEPNCPTQVTEKMHNYHNSQQAFDFGGEKQSYVAVKEIIVEDEDPRRGSCFVRD